MPAYDVDLSFARAQSLIGGATGGVPYQTATSATTFVTIGTNGYVLTSNGTSPQWSPASATTVGTSTQVNTILQTASATYYPAFVDSNNASSTPELVYTTSTFTINPATGFVGIGSQDGVSPLNVKALSTLSSVAASFQKVFTTQASGGNSNNVYRSEWRRRRATGADWTTQNIHDGIWVDASFTTPGTDTRTWWDRDPNTTSQAWGDQATTWMFVNSTGLGVGTTSPQAKFVVSNAGANGLEVNPTGGISSGALIQSYNRSGATYTQLSNYALGHTWQVGAAGTTRAVDIDSSGNVGIGTTSPGAKLDIQANDAGDTRSIQSVLPASASYNPPASNTPGKVVSGIKFNWYSDSWMLGAARSGGTSVDGFVISRNNTSTVVITANGALAFGLPTNYGTAGQVLQSNGDAAPTWVPVSGTTVGTSTQVQTVLRTTNATHYLTFVDSNNASATAEAVYTTSSFTINAMTGNVGIAAAPSSTATYRLNVSNIIQVGAQGGSDVTLIGGGAGTGSFLKGYYGTDGTQAFNILGNGDTYFNASTTKGNFGIGTNAPGYLLDVLKSTNDAIIRTKTSAAGAYFFADSVTNGFAGTVLLSNGSEKWFAGSYGYTSYAITQGRSSATTAFAIDTNNSVVIASRLSVGTTSTTNKFEVAGTSGQLFSVSDSFTGTIFAASDISGIPSIEVLDTGLVKFAQYNGQVTIGTGTVASSSATLSVYGMLYTTGTLGEIRASSEITAYFSSDRRLKENIKLIEDPITMIDQISGVYFDWTDEHIARRGGEDGYFVRKHDIGVIAQEIEAVMPEVVAQRADGFLAVKYEKIVPLLIEAIKAQQVDINLLKSEIQELKNRAN